MNLERVEKIADAVLYEGYILYPYRSSSVKNQQRWNFGALCPQSYSEAQEGTEAWTMQTECLVVGDEHTVFDVKVRFLHLLSREVGRLSAPILEQSDGVEPAFQTVAALEVGDRIYQTWQEAVEREVSLPGINLNNLVGQAQRRDFAFDSNREIELLNEPNGETAGVIVRARQAIEGSIEVSAQRAGERVFKVSARILNLTPLDDARHKSRDEALMRSLVSTHTILGARDGEFISLLEPPEEFREMAAACRNAGTWPVLVGEEGEKSCMLSSPIILYDYPQIAPESAGDLFDGTEIDEILTLRIMTLTDEEKREMRGVDERARRILERTERMPAEQLMKLHGAMRSVHPRGEDEQRSIKGEGSLMEIPLIPEGVEHNEWEWHLLEDKTPLDWVQSNGVALKTGDRVRLRPRPGGDIFDLALAGQIAVIEAIEQDYDNRVHLAVVLEDDPGRDLGMLRQPGHRFFFSPEEVEPLAHADEEDGPSA
jgi:hypothetical protein